MSIWIFFWGSILFKILKKDNLWFGKNSPLTMRNCSNSNLTKASSVFDLWDLSYPFLYFPVSPCVILFFLVLSYPVLSFPLLSCLILFFLVLSVSTVSCSVLSFSVLSYPDLSSPFLSCPLPFCPFLSCLVLSYHGLSFPALTYLVLGQAELFHHAYHQKICYSYKKKIKYDIKGYRIWSTPQKISKMLKELFTFNKYF